MNRQLFSQSDIDSFHWVKFYGQNGEVLYTLTGIIRVNMTGESQIWLRLPVTCKINIPELPSGQGFFVHYHAAFASLNSIFNKNVANNGGHAVTSFNLEAVHPDGNYGSKYITLSLTLGVSDSDAALYKVGFNITLAGVFRPLPPPDPCLDEQEAEEDLLRKRNGIMNDIAALNQLLIGATKAEREFYNIQIDERNEELRTCNEDLASARLALANCRAIHQAEPPEGFPSQIEN